MLKIQHIWSYGRHPWELRPRAIHFSKFPLSWFKYQLTCNAVTYHFRDIRGQIAFRGPNSDPLPLFGLAFGGPWRHRHQKGDKTHPRDSSIIMQNFTPIGCIAAEISVLGRRTKEAVNPLMGTRNYSATSNNMKLVVWYTGHSIQFNLFQ